MCFISVLPHRNGLIVCCHQAVETLKTFEKKDTRAKSTAGTNLSFLYFLVKSSSDNLSWHKLVFSLQMRLLSPIWFDFRCSSPTLHQEEDYEQAERYADVAMSADRYNPGALNNKGCTVFVKQDYEKAAEFFKEALRNDSCCTEALYNLGTACSPQ